MILQNTSRVPRFLARFMAPVDPIDEQLDQLRRQGAGMARIAHLCASLLVVLFSAGSFVALGVRCFAHRSRTVEPVAFHRCAVCHQSLRVHADGSMDVAMLAAAATLRLLASRRAPFQEMLLHVAVMAGVAALESGTYLFMSWTYEHPTSAAACARIIARALAAPLLAVYLASLVRAPHHV